MMKSRIYTAIVSLLFATCAMPCWHPSFSPRFYYTFRVYEDSVQQDEVLENCQAWQKLTGRNIPLEDIYQVVYKWDRNSYDLMEYYMDTDYLNHENAFDDWISETYNMEVLSFLKLAKECEETRFSMRSRWYYSVEGDDYQSSLERIAEKAIAYDGTLLKDRYTLQAVRALFSLGRMGECLELWEERSEGFKDGVIKDMIKGYIATCYFAVGENEKSDRLDAELGHCPLQKKDGTWMNLQEQMEWVYANVPESELFAKEIQKEMARMENHENFSSEEELNPQDSAFIWNKYKPLYKLCTQAAVDKRVKQRAELAYTAAYLADKLNLPAKARHWIAYAEQLPCRRYLKESIQVLRMYIDAKTLSYTASYEQRLYNQLQRLATWIKRDWSDKTLKEHDIVFEQTNGYSFFYWNDMLRKILLTEVAPRYLKQRNGIRAIQMVNMAENLLVNHTGIMQPERTVARIYNDYDYRNNLDALLDTIEVKHMMDYVQRVERPLSPFDRFLNEHGYTDLNYFNDRIGTRYLYDGHYAQAVKYLQKVPAAFQNQLNTNRYLRRNPFCDRTAANEGAKPNNYRNNGDAKLNFARQMMQLEEEIRLTSDPNRKAQQMLKYAIGMYNSHHRCWALTRYEDGMDYKDEEWSSNKKWWKKSKEVDEAYNRLLDEAFATFTDDECKANAYWQLGYIGKVIREYPQTDMANYIREHCDSWKDY